MINALTGDSLTVSRSNHSGWGRLIENAVGAHLLNHLGGIPYSVHYWRHKNLEVDFVVKTPKQLWGIEVKSGAPKNPKGISGFLGMSGGPHTDRRIRGHASRYFFQERSRRSVLKTRALWPRSPNWQERDIELEALADENVPSNKDALNVIPFCDAYGFLAFYTSRVIHSFQFLQIVNPIDNL